MAVQPTIGTRLRERRAALGLKQADLAERAGISPSYLNLIEHNRRRLPPELLDRLAAALGLAAEALQKGPGGALVDDLRAAAASATGPEMDGIEDFVARFPGWAALLAGLNARVASLGRTVEALNDRMTHDPHLSASLHEVLSATASVRSTAAILADTEDLEPEWRDRFLHNLHQDSERLAVGAEALVSYLDSTGQEVELGIASPQEEVEAWAAARNWDLIAAPDTSPPRCWCRRPRIGGRSPMTACASRLPPAAPTPWPLPRALARRCWRPFAALPCARRPRPGW